jgi:hypothetical protein
MINFGLKGGHDVMASKQFKENIANLASIRKQKKGVDRK